MIIYGRKNELFGSNIFVDGCTCLRDNKIRALWSAITATWRVNLFSSSPLYARFMCLCTACNCSYWEFVFMSKPCFYLSVRRWRKLLNKLIAEMISCCQEQTAREREYVCRNKDDTGWELQRRDMFLFRAWRGMCFWSMSWFKIYEIYSYFIRQFLI